MSCDHSTVSLPLSQMCDKRKARLYQQLLHGQGLTQQHAFLMHFAVNLTQIQDVYCINGYELSSTLFVKLSYGGYVQWLPSCTCLFPVSSKYSPEWLVAYSHAFAVDCPCLCQYVRNYGNFTSAHTQQRSNNAAAHNILTGKEQRLLEGQMRTKCHMPRAHRSALQR